MKKFLSVLLTATMVAGIMTGCGSSSSDSSAAQAPAASTTAESKEAPAAEAEGTVYHIGILQQLEHVALDASNQGFQDALVELLGDQVTFDVQNAQGEQANCASIASQFVADGDDLILAIATTALQCAGAATNEIPILGTAITDYATALDIKDWSGTTGTNISGTSDLAPLDKQEEMLVELFPDAKKVGILYCSAEPNSEYQAKVFAEALKADGIEAVSYTAADSNEIQAVATTAAEECDVIYVPTDNTMAANTEAINNVCLPAGVPIIAGEEGICSGCGVATLSISYYDIGYEAGKMAYEILVNGADVSTMEIKGAPEVTKEYNAANVEALGIKIPDGYVAIQ